jgi:predicted nucleotidyltransferase
VFTRDRESLDRIAETLRRRLPGNIVTIVAFGSRVRGDHDEGSDFDVLVVVRERTRNAESAIIDEFVEEELRTGTPFAPVIKTEESYQMERDYHTPFAQSIAAEGIHV